MLQEFSYLSPSTSDELYAILREKAGAGRLFAGGTDLLVDIRGGKASPACLIDLKKIEKYHILSYSDMEGLSIGTAVTCRELITSTVTRAHYPLLAEVAEHLGSPQLRNRATIVGNICTASPSADMAPMLLCLEASVEMASKEGLRRVPLREFFTGVKKTSCAAHEVVERIIVPPHLADAKGGYEKLKRIKGHDLALANVALIKKGDIVKVAIGACSVTPVLLKDFSSGTSAADIVNEAERSIKPIDDIRASREYRLFMVKTYVERLMTALQHAQ